VTHGPTLKQSALLGFIASFIDGHGYPPTLADIRRHTGARSPTAGLDMLNSLVRKGLLEKRPRISRGITITAKGRAELARVGDEHAYRKALG
jgi:repressor LexA